MTTTSQAGAVPLPGRLGNPAPDLRSDPRADPRMVAALATVGMDTPGAPPSDVALAYALTSVLAREAPVRCP